VPILIGPLQVLLAILPAILVSIFATLVAMFKPSSLKAFARILWRNKLIVVIVVLVGAGIWQGIAYLADRWQPKAGNVERGKAEWTMFRGGMTRRGAALDEAPDPTMPANIWAFTRATKTFYSSPAVLGNLLFIASVEGIGPFNQEGDGAIYCLDANTGAVVWRYAPKGCRGTFSSPSISGEYLVCGEGLHFTSDARIICLRLKGDSFEVLWEYETSSHVESSPCIYDGNAYIGAGDDGFYCIALEPGPDGKADVQWHLVGDNYLDCEASPAVVDGKVFFCIGMGGKAIVCADAKTGKELWRRDAPYPVFGHPTIVGTNLFVGMGNGNFVETAEVAAIKELDKLKKKGASEAELAAAEKSLVAAGEVWCLNTETGEPLWKHKVKRTVLGAVAAADGRLYFGDRDGTFTSITLDNKLPRRRNLHEALIASPSVAKDHVYVLTEHGKLYCLDKLTLEPVWNMQLGTGSMYLSSPAVALGHVFVGTDMNGLLCVGQPSTARQIASWPGPLGGPGKSGWSDQSPVSDRYRFAWRHPKTESSEDAKSVPVPIGPVAVVEGDILLSLGGEMPGVARLEPGAKSCTQKWFHATTATPLDSPAVVGKTAFVVEGKPGDSHRSLRLLNVESGALSGQRPVESQAVGTMLVTAKHLLIYDKEAGLSSYDVTVGEDEVARLQEKATWRAAVELPVGMPVLGHGMVFISCDAPASVKALSLISGQELWSKPLSASPVTGVVLNEQRLAVGTEQGISVLSVLDGAIEWENACGKIEGPLVADSALLGCSLAGAIALFDWEGQKLTQAEETVPGLPPMLCADKVLYLKPDGVEAYDLSLEETHRLAGRLSWLGRAVTPAVMVKSQLYFGTQDRGLVCLRPR
jgi:outer membrane protein assembly factor BamB